MGPSNGQDHRYLGKLKKETTENQIQASIADSNNRHKSNLEIDKIITDPATAQEIKSHIKPVYLN